MVHTSSDPSFAELLAAHPSLQLDVHDGLLLEETPLHAISAELGTPCWVTSAGTLRRRAQRFRTAFESRNLPIRYHFAVKSQDHQASLTVLRQCGFGADVVSGGEMQRALAAGMPPEAILFSGVGKTDDELRLAVAHDIAQVNVESAEELFRLSAIAAAMERSVRVALRVNPDVDAATHDKISTGRAGDKFGISHADIPSLYRQAAALPGIRIVGLAVHLGSQMLTSAPFRRGYQRVADLVRTLRSQQLTVECIDCGGGLGIRYRDEIAPAPDMLAGIIAEIFSPLGVTLRVEPGRWLCAPAGLLLTRVIETKKGQPDFAIIDAGMNELLRPALYNAWHGILPVAPHHHTAPLRPWDVVGPICESSDIFAKDRKLPDLQRGDLLALIDTGAYGSVMSSTYNSRPLAAQAMVEGAQWSVIRPRQSVEALIAAERIPDWLQTA